MEVSLINLENISDAKCAAEFLKSDVYKLAEIMQIPPMIKSCIRSVFDGLKCFCVFLTHCRFAYPCRYGDIFQDLEGRYLNSALYQMQQTTFTIDLDVYYMSLINLAGTSTTGNFCR